MSDEVGIRFVAGAGDFHVPVEPGAWLEAFDPDAADGRGRAEWTTDPGAALRFDDVETAEAFWQQQSTAQPLRSDGEPNRPLTAFTVQVWPLDADAKLQQIRAMVGSVVEIYRFPTARHAGAAFKQIEAKRQGISAWRFSSGDKSLWFVCVMAEESHADQVRFARTTMRAAGGRPVDEGELDDGVIERLRNRRFQQAVDAVMRGERNLNQRVSYGLGAVLHADGSMSPAFRPQG